MEMTCAPGECLAGVLRPAPCALLRKVYPVVDDVFDERSQRAFLLQSVVARVGPAPLHCPVVGPHLAGVVK